jgi:hypothetical protein
MSNSSKLDISSIYEQCGIIAVCLVDPLSLLINKILDLKNDEPNGVGFYYETNIQGIKATNVMLFNIYDNNAISWLKLGCTMDRLLNSPFVHRITYYPAAVTEDGSTSLMTKLSLGHISPNKLDNKFRAHVIETIRNNAQVLHDKNYIYTMLLRHAFNLTTDNKPIITGFSLVNRVLALLSNSNNKRSHVDSNLAIDPCPMLKKHVSLVTSNKQFVIDDHVVEESRKEITNLLAVFIDLFTTSEDFCKALQNKNLHDEPLDFTKLFRCEEELVTAIVSSVQAGLLSNVTLNDHIKQLVKQRLSLGNNTPLTMSIRPAAHIQVMQQEIMCSFQQPPMNNVNSLRDLGAYISHLVQAFNAEQPLTINLGGIVAAYNLTVENTDLPTISLNHHIGSHTLSRAATVTIPGDPTIAAVTIPEHNIVIPIYDANLTILTETQLTSSLVYIDSLRAPDGEFDTRFANIQNEIVRELARRQSVDE